MSGDYKDWVWTLSFKQWEPGDKLWNSSASLVGRPKDAPS